MFRIIDPVDDDAIDRLLQHLQGRAHLFDRGPSPAHDHQCVVRRIHQHARVPRRQRRGRIDDQKVVMLPKLIEQLVDLPQAHQRDRIARGLPGAENNGLIGGDFRWLQVRPLRQGERRDQAARVHRAAQIIDQVRLAAPIIGRAQDIAWTAEIKIDDDRTTPHRNRRRQQGQGNRRFAVPGDG